VVADEHRQQQKVRNGRRGRNEIKNIYDRSRYVYENKENKDKMPGEKLDIYFEVTRILPKSADFRGQFVKSCDSGAVLDRIYREPSLPHTLFPGFDIFAHTAED
jgi:hypothetical protein